MSQPKENNSPGFFAVIPANVRYCKNLEPSAKLLYGELTALARREGYCWASNEYFADLYQVTDRTITNWLSSLQNEGFIKLDTKKIGMTWDRKIWIIQESFTKGKNFPDRGEEIFPIDQKKISTEQIHCLSNTKIQQQQAAAAVPKKEEERKPGVYPCLKDIDVSIRVKQDVTKKHTLEQVEHALKWLKHNDKPLHRGLAAALIWACDAQPEIHEPKETPYEKVKKLFTNGMIYNGAECYLNSDRIAFVRNTKDEHVKFDNFFKWKKIVDLCDSFQIQIRWPT